MNHLAQDFHPDYLAGEDYKLDIKSSKPRVYQNNVKRLFPPSEREGSAQSPRLRLVGPELENNFEPKAETKVFRRYFFGKVFWVGQALFSLTLLSFVAVIHLRSLNALQEIKSDGHMLNLSQAERIKKIESDTSGLTHVVHYLVDNKKEHSLQNSEEGNPSKITTRLERESVTHIYRERVAKVVAPRANLRQGPGENYPSVMTVSEGSKLVVIEDSDKWLKVASPNGQPLWLLKEISIIQG